MATVPEIKYGDFPHRWGASPPDPGLLWPGLEKGKSPLPDLGAGPRWPTGRVAVPTLQRADPSGSVSSRDAGAAAGKWSSNNSTGRNGRNGRSGDMAIIAWAQAQLQEERPGRERPLTQRWPCPQAGPASRDIRPSGPTGTSGCPHFFFWVFLSNSPPPLPPLGAGRAIKRPSSRSEVPPNPVPRNQARPPSHVRLGPERLAGASGVVRSASLVPRPPYINGG